MEIKRYDIVQVDFGEPLENIQGGIRPALIFQNNMGNRHSPTTLVMPMSTKIKKTKMPTHTLIRKSADTGLKTDSILLSEQMRVINKSQIIKKLGHITDTEEQKAVWLVYQANFGE